MSEIIRQVLFAFSDGHCRRVELPITGDPLRFYENFYKAMRRRGLSWRLSVEGGRVLHVSK